MELLIRTVDKGPADDQSNAGHVIAICPDGWGWSAAEKANPEWVIVKADLLQVEAEALLAGPSDPMSKSRRKFKLNPAGLKHGDKIPRAALMAKVSQL